MKFAKAGAVLFFLALLPIRVYAQCSFSVVETSTDDPRGYGLDISVSGGDDVNYASLSIYRGPVQLAIGNPVWGNTRGEPVSAFYKLECLNETGDLRWEVFTACQSHRPEGSTEVPYDDERFTGTFSTRGPSVFEARLLSPPTAEGNVEVKYDFPPAASDPVIHVPGVTDAVFVDGAGVLVLNLPPGTHQIKASWCRTSATERTKFVTIVVPSTDNRAVVEFDMSPPSTRVLIGKYGPDSYPSALQTADRRIRVNATVRNTAGAPAPGKTIHFRLIDPEDAADYVRRAGDARTGDNAGGPGALNGGTTATTVSDSAGQLSVILEVTDHAAGDNYQIEATADSGFDCAKSPCGKSPVYIAWKRVYVEVNKMFRHGAYITRPVAAGDTLIAVSDVRAFPAPPFRLRLIHAPSVYGYGPPFRSEVVTIGKVDGRRFFSFGRPEPGLLHLEASGGAIEGSYATAETIPGRPREKHPEYLADAVGVVTGDRERDYYLAHATLVNPVMNDAFTEYVWLTDATAGVDSDLDAPQPRLAYDAAIPFEESIDTLDKFESTWIARKWMQNATRAGVERVTAPNHQILFTATRNPDNHGFTRVGSGFNDTWLFVGRLRNRTHVTEALAHELAHQWRVNRHRYVSSSATGSHGHCDWTTGAVQKMYNRSLKCPMTASLYGDPEEAEADDGILAFHYVRVAGTVDSEYLYIRRRLDPVPQNDEAREAPR